ncbi:MAG: hypothetical protein WCG08_16825 [Paludibacter sp.]|jgi:hypothetical protein
MPELKGHAPYYTKPKGYQNKVTTQTKELITAFMLDKFNDVAQAWERLMI